MKAREIRLTPYVRVHHTGVVVWGQFSFGPYIARLLGNALLRAADRIDPQRTAKAPWHKEVKQ